jgi:hypothetical protein
MKLAQIFAQADNEARCGAGLALVGEPQALHLSLFMTAH